MADERVDATGVEAAGRGDHAGEERPVDFEEGRYIFCVVRIDGDPANASFSTEGIDGREVGLVVAGDLAAVTQPCESLYDASDPETVRRWLLRHQSVVDAAGETFGTPLPFRFDTVVVGDDDRVREWLGANADRIDAALSDLDGRWEYRIEVSVEEGVEAETLEDEDDRLATLRAEIDDADEGRAFLTRKQYDERLRELRRERREARAEDLVDRIEPLADRAEWDEASPAGPSILDAGGDGSATASTAAADRPAISLSVLATPEAAEAIGEELEAVADDPAVEIRYTGPWPPYSFAPDIGADEGR